MDLLVQLPLGVFLNDSYYLVNSSTFQADKHADAATHRKFSNLEPDEDETLNIVRPYIVGANSLIFVVGLLVNVFLIVAIRLSPRLKAPIFQLQFSLIFADIITLLSFALPEISWLGNGDIWWFGSDGCTALVFLQFLAAHITMCLIVICCWERFYAVCRPHSSLLMTSRKMSGAIAISWIINAGALSPLLFMSKTLHLVYSDSLIVSTCQFTMPEHLREVYLTALWMVFFVMATIISAVFLACSIWKVRNIDLELNMIKDDFKNHILRTITVTTALTVLLWIPYRYIYFNEIHGQQSTSAKIITLSNICVLLSAATKPIVYVVMSSQFRKAVFRALKCCNRNQVDYHATHDFKVHDALEMPEREPL